MVRKGDEGGSQWKVKDKQNARKGRIKKDVPEKKKTDSMEVLGIWGRAAVGKTVSRPEKHHKTEQGGGLNQKKGALKETFVPVGGRGKGSTPTAHS